ncbi:helicase-related protein [Rhodospirillum sp. A1_3_36]|uniref:helicase-related protein n=1 Tax=Rhodospirillum sp. A1_3_36 TaxID=3391666 RepID=UPI0039A76139
MSRPTGAMPTVALRGTSPTVGLKGSLGTASTDLEDRLGPVGISAVLGPTNTGKTHLAMERMLGHPTGMIGFPLRLLARENYDRVVARVGVGRVALITGEEKILPPRPSYYICTVESMPVDQRVDFLAVDEIQLCGDPDRGHVFTDRLLHARGRVETMFMGAETMTPLIRRLVPGCIFDTRPRFSKLAYAGHRKLTRLPRRSAVVAFSADDVYAIAELTRRQRGGAAVVMGALSPRTRNAQVALYQSGEVDYLVATDAIGMGLNMDVDHVAFAALTKFDGHATRHLTAAEVAQIAGRAGRHMNDGTFGVTADARKIADDVVECVESHSFPSQRQIFWRNTHYDFHSVNALLSSLFLPPPDEGLRRPRFASDQHFLETLSRDPEIEPLAKGKERVSLLWDVCRVPDFRKRQTESHVRLLSRMYKFLTQPGGRLPDEFVAAMTRGLDRTDGDIHTLVDRIAAIRVWTYVSHQGRWLSDPGYWRGETRAIEDRLSDALHDRLTQRFVDRRTSVLMRRLGERAMLDAQVAASDGRVTVEGHEVGRLEGLTFHPEATGEKESDKAVLNAAREALRPEIGQRVTRLAADDDVLFKLDERGTIFWRGAPVARLEKGSEPLRPGVALPGGDFLDEVLAEKARTRLTTWLDSQLTNRLKPLIGLRDADLKGAARGLAFQLIEALGTLSRRGNDEQLDSQVRALEEDDRKALARVGVRLGVETLFMPDLLKPDPQRLLAVLWRLWNDREGGAVPADGRVSFPVDARAPHAFYRAIGYRVVGNTAVRVDMIERFAADVRRMVREESQNQKDQSQQESAKAALAKTEDAKTEDAKTGDAKTGDESAAALEAQTPAADTPITQAPVDETPVLSSPSEAPSDTPDETTDTTASEQAAEEPPKPEKVIPQAQPGEVRLPPDMLPPLGIGVEDGASVLSALGYGTRLEEGALFLKPRRRKQSRQNQGKRGGPRKSDDARGPKSEAGSGETRTEGQGEKRTNYRGEKRTEGRGEKRSDNRSEGRGKRPDKGSKPQGGPPNRRPKEPEYNPDSPFARLRELMNK